MNTVRQAFRNHRMAMGALLGGVAWVNPYDSPTSLFSFVGDVLYQLVPGSITDALVQATIGPVLHVLDVQVFKGDDLIDIHKFSTQLVGDVSTLVGYALVDVLHDSLGLASCRCALLAPGESALRLGQCLFCLAKEAGGVHRSAGREGGEVGQPNVNTDNVRRRLKRLRFHFYREASVPVAEHIPFDGKRLNLAFDGTMQLNSHVTYLVLAPNRLCAPPAYGCRHGGIAQAYAQAWCVAQT